MGLWHRHHTTQRRVRRTEAGGRRHVSQGPPGHLRLTRPTKQDLRRAGSWHEGLAATRWPAIAAKQSHSLEIAKLGWVWQALTRAISMRASASAHGNGCAWQAAGFLPQPGSQASCLHCSHSAQTRLSRSGPGCPGCPGCWRGVPCSVLALVEPPSTSGHRDQQAGFQRRKRHGGERERERKREREKAGERREIAIARTLRRIHRCTHSCISTARQFTGLKLSAKLGAARRGSRLATVRATSDHR